MENHSIDPNFYSVENYEGPLVYLLHLVQKSEISLSDVTLHRITEQFMARLQEVLPDMEIGGEFLGTTASLLWLKSKLLLPRETIDEEELPEEDPFLSLIPELIDYCRFKDISKQLKDREESQQGAYFRGFNTSSEEVHIPPPPPSDASVLIHLFQDLLERAEHRHRVIEEEVWKVADKVTSIRQLFKSGKKAELKSLFPPERPKGEWVVTFLAILELLKIGEAELTPISEQWFIGPKLNEASHAAN